MIVPGVQLCPRSAPLGNPEGDRELDQGVDAGDPQAALVLTDLGPMQLGADAQLLLRKLGPATTAG